MIDMNTAFIKMMDEMGQDFKDLDEHSNRKSVASKIASLQGWDVAIDTAVRQGQIMPIEREILRYYVRAYSLKLHYIEELIKLREEVSYETLLVPYIDDCCDD